MWYNSLGLNQAYSLLRQTDHAKGVRLCQNNANEMAVFNTAIYVRLSKEDIVAAQSGRESNSITNQKQLVLDFLKDKPEFNIVSIRIDDGYTGTNFDRPAFQLHAERY